MLTQSVSQGTKARHRNLGIYYGYFKMSHFEHEHLQNSDAHDRMYAYTVAQSVILIRPGWFPDGVKSCTDILTCK